MDYGEIVCMRIYVSCWCFCFIVLSFFRSKLIEEARAHAERVKLLGTAEATAISAKGRAEAEAMRLRAAAYRQYGDAAVTSLVLEQLPKVRVHDLHIYHY